MKSRSKWKVEVEVIVARTDSRKGRKVKRLDDGADWSIDPRSFLTRLVSPLLDTTPVTYAADCVASQIKAAAGSD